MFKLLFIFKHIYYLKYINYKFQQIYTNLKIVKMKRLKRLKKPFNPTAKNKF